MLGILGESPVPSQVLGEPVTDPNRVHSARVLRRAQVLRLCKAAVRHVRIKALAVAQKVPAGVSSGRQFPQSRAACSVRDGSGGRKRVLPRERP